MIDFLKLKPRDKIAVFGYLNEYQIKSRIVGDSLIYESLMGDLNKNSISVKYFSFQDYGIIGKILTKIWKQKDKNYPSSKNKTNGNFKFTTTAISLIGLNIISKIDILFRFETQNVIRQYEKVIIFSPWLLFSQKTNNDMNMKTKEFYLFEVNNELKHTEFHTRYRNKTILIKLILKFVYFIESRAINVSKGVLTLSKRDLESIKELYDPEKTMVYRINIPDTQIHPVDSKTPDFEGFNINGNSKIKITSTNKQIKILFIGSRSPINKKGTDELLKYAFKFRKIIFIIVGSIGYEYKNMINLPENFVVLGFLDNLERIIPFIDYSILFDWMETGLEVKAYDYAKFGIFTLIVGNSTSSEYEDLFKGNSIVFKEKEEVLNFLGSISMKDH